MIIPNTSAVIYNAVPPNEAGKRGSLSSNTVNTEVLSDAITKVIKTDKTFVNAGEIFHNTIYINKQLIGSFRSDPYRKQCPQWYKLY